MWLHGRGAVDVTGATHGLAMTGAFGIHGTHALRGSALVKSWRKRNLDDGIELVLIGELSIAHRFLIFLAGGSLSRTVT